jgi:hypothetical protein
VIASEISPSVTARQWHTYIGPMLGAPNW